MNKIKIIFRSILRHKLNPSVIIVSLAIGLACFNIIMAFLHREIKSDSFHEKRDMIFSLSCDDPWLPGEKMYHCRFGSAEYMKNNFTEVEDICRIRNSTPKKVFTGNKSYFDGPRVIEASANFFSFFSYRLLSNNQGTALEANNNIVISDELATRYFGTDEALGQVIDLVYRDRTDRMVVSGIFSKPADNSQITFDMVRPVSDVDSRCYIRLSAGSDKEKVEQMLEKNKDIIPVIHDGTIGRYYLKSLKDTYFDTTRRSSVEASRDITDLWVAFILGIMILGIASFNYMGLLNNRLSEKTKEYSIRRINGGSVFSFIVDFMIENTVIIVIAFILSLIIIREIIPFFNNLTESNISINDILIFKRFVVLLPSLLFLLIITLVFIIFGIRSGIKRDINSSGQNILIKKMHFPAFNIFQLAGSVGLVICSFVIIRQMNFISDRSIGLDKQVIEIKLPGEYSDKAPLFREELRKYRSIESVSAVSASPVLEHFLVLLNYEEDGKEKQYSPAGFMGDEYCLTTLGIQLLKGPGFLENSASNSGKCVVNETLTKMFPEENLIGRGLPGMEDLTISGIVKDFNYSSLKDPVQPAFITYDNTGSHLMVKPVENQAAQTRDIISAVWEELIPDYPPDIESIGERYNWLHRENNNYIRLMASSALITLFLSIIGLFAISFQDCSRRTKEIGIRKINGARIVEIVKILNRDFIKWIAYAFLLASPVAWFSMNKWLQNFAYKEGIRWWIFPLTGIIILLIISITVSWQSLRAATQNPVEALRYE